MADDMRLLWIETVSEMCRWAPHILGHMFGSVQGLATMLIKFQNWGTKPGILTALEQVVVSDSRTRPSESKLIIQRNSTISIYASLPLTCFFGVFSL